jgi:hypothetical protein
MVNRVHSALSEEAQTETSKENAADIKKRIEAVFQKIKDDSTATGSERIAAVLDAVRQILQFVPGKHERVNAALSLMGISLDTQRLRALGSRQAIAAALTPSFTPQGALAVPAPVFQEVFGACDSDAAVISIRLCSEIGFNHTFEFSRSTADVNLGPISNEVMQVLQAASRGLAVITDPANADRWRLGTAYANSDSGPGNHNSIIYFENMGLPKVKSSAFDPTKFVVAAGALYRQVFSASVAAFGAPLPATAGAAGAPDFQSSNLIATRARVRNAEKAAAAARQKILDALKVAVDEQKKVTDDAWKKDSAAVLKSAQDALQGAASQLEATAGKN